MLTEQPLSLRVIREAHARLLAGDRGRGKSPGEFRHTPVWIGGPGSTPETATFVPAPAEQVPDGMSAWERYVHADPPDRLVQIAVQHAEFEAVHPFLDGNGRLGRMLIPLLMRQYGLIGTPVFCVSRQIASRRIFYYDGLLGVSRDDDWTGWCLYLLDTIRAQGAGGRGHHPNDSGAARRSAVACGASHPGPVRRRGAGPSLRAPRLPDQRIRGHRGDPVPHRAQDALAAARQGSAGKRPLPRREGARPCSGFPVCSRRWRGEGG